MVPRSLHVHPVQHESQAVRRRDRLSYKTIYRRVQRFLRALDAPRLQLEGPVEIDEFYVKAGLKGRERDGGRARVACPRADVERTLRTSSPSLFSQIEAVVNGT